MALFSTKVLKNGLLVLLAALPLLSQGQTTIVNHDFNSATSYATATAATASGVSSAVTSSETFSTATGTATGSGAFASNATGTALGMASNNVATARYFQFALSGAALPKYSAYKVYFQGYRSSAAAVTLTLQYSLDGTSYTNFGAVYTPGSGSFSEASFDLSGVSALTALSNLSFRLLTSTNTSGTLRVDNFQVQAVNTVDALITSLSPSTIEAGSADFALTVTGNNFKPGAVVSLAGQNLATTYNTSTSLVATVPAAAVATAGSYPVAVTNPGGTASASATLTVTPALVHWTGGPAGSGTSWFEPSNWSTGAVPATTDEVMLDHRYLAGRYTVNFDQNTPVSIKSLTVNPGTGDSILALVPATNTATTALTLTNTGTGAVALAIYNKGVVTNASGASSGTGIEVTNVTDSNPGATVFIYNGGSYRHATVRGHATVVENLSAIVGTELGIFDFRPFSTGSGSTALSLSGRTYGTLILRSRPNQTTTTSYTGAGTAVTIQGNLLIGQGVSFAPAINNDLRIVGDVRAQGTLQMKATSPASSTSQLLLAGTKPQVLLGTILFDAGIGLAINNPTGVVLAATISLAGPLTLTRGVFTVAAANQLTLSSTATIVGGSSTSFVSGPLARQTAAGALTNLLFPLGSGTSYRPVTLNATAQDATTYLVTQAEGPAPDYANLPASTSALPQLTRVSRARSYTITPTPAANNFAGTVTLPFDPTDQVNAPNDASFVIGKNSGNGWQNIGNSAVTVTTPAPAGGYASGTITSGTFTSFSSFALASTSADVTVNPLPVTLTSFVARRQAAAVRLNWTTAVEQNNARFEVQRSLDGQLFVTVATVAGQGTTTQAHQYAALDPAAPAVALYYRLAQVDEGGRTTFSPVVALAATGTVGLYPNPARDWLTVPAAPGTLVRILDLTGRVLHTLALPPSGELNVASLPAGTYLLRLEEGTPVLRFTKE